MTRTAPDPVFAAAALEEVQQRLRDHRRTAPASGRGRRPWIVELSAVAGVAALAAGAVFAVHTLQPTPDRDGAPIGSISRTAEPTPAVTPSATPSDTPSPTAPTAPATTPPPTAPTAPPSSPSTPTTTTTAPPAAGSSTLVGPTGAVLRTDAQIRAYAQGRGFSDIWAQQGILDRDCMAAQGFLYDPEAGLSDTGGMSSADRAAFSSALLGPPTSEPYDWRTAGCHGASVHETGQDGKD